MEEGGERFQGGRLKEPLNEGCCRGTGGGRLVQPESLQSSLRYLRELIDFGGGEREVVFSTGIGLIRSKWDGGLFLLLLLSLFLFAF